MSAPETPKRRHPVLRGTAAVAAAAVLGLSVTGYAAARKYDSKIQRVQVFAGLQQPNRPEAAAVTSLEPMNFLLVGIDNRAGLTAKQRSQWHLGSGDYGNQTDTIMIIHIGRDAQHVTVVGLPRDSLVTIPAHTAPDGTQRGESQDRINAAFTIGGAALTVKTVEQATGIHIDHYIGVSLLGFVNMVDAVDGVEVCLTEPVKDNPKYTALDLPAGKSNIRGRMALSFVRARHVGTDFGRMARQQQFMASLLKKATSLGIMSNPIKLDAFVSAAAESLVVDETLDRSSLVDLAQKLSSVKLDQIEFAKLPIASDNYTIPGTDRSEFVTWGEPGSKEIFNAIATDTPLVVKRTIPTATPSASPSESASPTPTPTPSAPVVSRPPSTITVHVLNGSGIAGLGTKASEELTAFGFKVPQAAGLAKGSGRANTLIRYDSTLRAGAVQTLRNAFPDAELQSVQGLGVTTEITVGSGFTDVIDPSVMSVPSATAAPSSSASGAQAVAPRDISVRVLNGSGVVGQATSASSALESAGFTIADSPASSPDGTRATTLVRYDSSYTKSAETLRAMLPDAQFEPVDGFGEVFEVTVGSSYTGLASSSSASQSPSAVPSPTFSTNADPSDISALQKPVLATSTVCN